MKFIIPLIGYFLSAGFVRAEISFFEFIKQNQNEFIQFKLLDQSFAIKSMEKKAYKASFSNGVSLEQGMAQTRSLPSAKDFEGSQNSNHQSITYDRVILNTGTKFKIYSKFVNNKVVGKRPVFSKVPKPYSVTHGVVIEQSLARNNFGDTVSAHLKRLDYAQKLSKFETQNLKLYAINNLARDYAELIHLGNLQKVFIEKCEKSLRSLKIAHKKRKRDLITQLELGLIKHDHSNCKNQLKTLDLHKSKVGVNIQGHFLSRISLDQIKSFKIKLTPSKKELEEKLKARREYEKKLSKYHLKEAKTDLRPDIKLALEYHNYGEGSANSFKHIDQSSQLSISLKYTIPFGDTHRKQELRLARIQKLSTELVRLRQEKMLRANYTILKNENTNILLRVASDIERLKELRSLNLKARKQFAKGIINYDQLGEVAHAYYETQIKVQEEKKSLFLNNISKLLITKRLTGVL